MEGCADYVSEHLSHQESDIQDEYISYHPTFSPLSVYLYLVSPFSVSLGSIVHVNMHTLFFSYCLIVFSQSITFYVLYFSTTL